MAKHNGDGQGYKRLQLKRKLKGIAVSALGAQNVIRNQALLGLTEEQHESLVCYLTDRLKRGQNSRGHRLSRMLSIDRSISTWQMHDEADSKRLDRESRTGEQSAIAQNLPMLATHLDDLASFYADTLAPIQTPFVSNDVSPEIQEITKRLSKDAQSRNYYAHVVASARAWIKYNIGGIIVEWERGGLDGSSASGVHPDGNAYLAADMYNTMWDESVDNPEDIPTQAEWGCYVRLANRVTTLRNTVTGYWVNTHKVLQGVTDTDRSGRVRDGLRLWFDSSKAVPTVDGKDSKTYRGNVKADFDWDGFGMSLPNDAYSDFTEYDERYELTTMYCWICPEAHGLLNWEERTQLKNATPPLDPNSYLELWRFELLNNATIVSARPQSPRERRIMGEVAVVPIFVSYLIRDELKQAQRSNMELLMPFQRTMTSVMAIAIAGLRKNVWGAKGYDPTMFDLSEVEGKASFFVKSKVPGRDVRSGLISLDSSNDISEIFSHLGTLQQLKQSFFPTQSVSAQVAGLDRAVTNQVSTIVHGAQRALRMNLRIVDTTIMRPARLESVRNLQRYEAVQADAEIDDEQVAQALGSGVDSLESERITEALWRLLMAIIQNQEAAAIYDVPQILAYLGRVLRLNVDMSTFVKQQPPAAMAAAPGAGGAPMSPEEQEALAMAVAQGASPVA